jgi:hypothetical protein
MYVQAISHLCDRGMHPVCPTWRCWCRRLLQEGRPGPRRGDEVRLCSPANKQSKIMIITVVCVKVSCIQLAQAWGGLCG